MSDSPETKPPQTAALKPLGAEDLARLARLARLELAAGETPRALRAVNDILAMMEKLRTADADGGDALSHVQFWGESLRLREDRAAPGYPPEELLAAAPKVSGSCFAVPKVIE